MTYSQRFFESIREGSTRSAATVVPKLHEIFEPSSVVDVGCGEGHWGKVFEELGAEVVGLDGSAPEPVISMRQADLSEGVPDDLGCFDLALCLEVAEHLPESSAADLVDGLCRLSPVVVFSAAVPGQGGTGHLNEQWPDYWAEHFASNGYSGSGALRWRFWSDDRLCWWYRQNLLVFSKDPMPLAYDGCPAVVHPAAWKHHGH